jgi:cell division protein FtsI (penicillin-binding protein 3)
MRDNSAKPDDRGRVVVVALATFFLFSLLIVQFYRVQIVQHQKWADRAQNQHTFTLVEPFIRGRFFSNTTLQPGVAEKEQPLVMDIQMFHLFADPMNIPEERRLEVAEALSATIDEATEQVFEELGHSRSRSRKLAMWLSRETKQKILAWWTPYARSHRIPRNALFFQKDYRRSYPFGKLLGQVLHTIQDNKDASTKQAVPTGGLEASFHHLLRGKLGKRRLLRSPRNAMETGEVVDEPEDGADIYLTINHYLQAVMEEELARGVLKARAKGGWAVMMEPNTGEIYALAQYPFFDPARYRDYFNDPDLIEHARVKAVTDAYEPGSVMKPIGLALALEANSGGARVFDPNEKIASADGRFPGRSRAISDVRVHKFLNMDLGLQKSSNIYVGRVADKVIRAKGDRWYRAQLHDRFGLGQKTGIELPIESAGMLPTPGKMYANGRSEWSKPTPYSLAMGYNLQVNSLQMLRAWAVLANGGYLVEPTLVRRVVKNGEVLPRDVASRKKVLDDEVVEKLLRSMRFVTQTTGSGRRANIPGYTEIGKTATSKKLENGVYSSSKYLAAFVGYAPAEDPRFVLLIALDEPDASIPNNYYGGVVAAPVFRAIGKRALEFLGVAPDDPDGTYWAEESAALAAKYDEWNG